MKRLSALWANDKLINECTILGNPDVLISSVCIHSADCKEHSLFVAQKGIHTDGHLYINKAIERGATAVAHSSPIEEKIHGITYIHTSDPLTLSSLFAYNLHSPYPSSILGVTGTDGKSTTCEFLHSILTSSGAKCGLLSTLSIDTGNGKISSPYRMSTPHVNILYPFLHECYENGVDYVVLETTSHGLSFQTARLKYITFSGAILSNITSEHLDFHGTVDNYINDKMNLVRQLQYFSPIVTQDTFSQRPKVESLLKSTQQLYTYSFENSSTDALICATTCALSLDERGLLLQKGDEKIVYNLPYAPSVYAHNFLLALTLASIITNKPLKSLVGSPLHIEKMSGRFEFVYRENGKIIINDFAHTKSAFYYLFSFIKTISPASRVIALFGAAGERDKSKREGLGEMASTFCDILYLTDEDSRGEKVEGILEDIKRGFISKVNLKFYVIPERKKALREAISSMKQNDILLLLGKGHEKSIDHGSYTEEYDETLAAKEVLRSLT